MPLPRSLDESHCAISSLQNRELVPQQDRSWRSSLGRSFGLRGENALVRIDHADLGRDRCGQQQSNTQLSL